MGHFAAQAALPCQLWSAIHAVLPKSCGGWLPGQVYAELAEDGYDVEYLRVPVTDEKAPKERDLAELQARVPSGIYDL